jgi:hypothetical protein
MKIRDPLAVSFSQTHKRIVDNIMVEILPLKVLIISNYSDLRVGQTRGRGSRVSHWRRRKTEL